MITNSKISNTTTTQVFLASGQQAITTMIFCNVASTSTAYLDVFVVPHGQNPGGTDPNQIMSQVEIPAAETFVLDTERLILEDLDAIYAQTSVANSIVCTVSSVSTA